MKRKPSSNPNPGAADSLPRAKRAVTTAEIVILVAILLAGLGLRAAYLSELSHAPDFEHPLADAGFHDYWARGLATGEWQPPGDQPNPQIGQRPFLRPPGYPYFLALVYRFAGLRYVAPRVAQMGLGLLSALLGYWLVRRLFGPRPALLIAAFLSLYWALIYFEGELQAPVLLVFLGLLVAHALVWLARRITWSRALLCGLAIGAFTLVRVNLLLFVPVVLVWSWWVARRQKTQRLWPVAALALIVGTITMIAPATIRNYVVAREFVLVSVNGGINLYAGNNEQSDGVSAKLPVLEAALGQTGWSWFRWGDVVAAVERSEGRSLTTSEVSSFFSRRARAYMFEHPGRTLSLMGKRTLLFWGPAEIANNKAIAQEREHSYFLRYGPGFPSVLACCLIGLVLLALEHRRPAPTAADDARWRFETAVSLVAMILVYFVSFLPFLVAARFRVPVLPLMAIFAAYGIDCLISFATQRKWPHLIASVVGLFAIWLLMRVEFVPYKPQVAWWHTDRAAALVAQGQLDLAADEYRAALDAQPAYVAARFGLAGILAKQGQPAQAIEHYQAGLKLQPDAVDAWLALARLLSDASRSVEAVNAYQSALQQDPQRCVAWINLGVELAQQQRYGQAAASYRKALALDARAADAWFNLGKAEAAQGNDAKAQTAYCAALEIDPKHEQAHVNLGNLLRKGGGVSAAIEHYHAAVQINPQSFVARYNLAGALAVSGRTAEAIEQFEAALRINPQHPGAQQALQTLRARQNQPGG